MIDVVLARYRIPPEWCEVVDDVLDWCRQNGIDDDDPFRAAKCFYTPAKCHIVLSAIQTDDLIAGGKSRMLCDGLGDEVARLDTDVRYLLHLVLHEVAAFTLQVSDQLARDRWAFDEMQHHSTALNLSVAG